MEFKFFVLDLTKKAITPVPYFPDFVEEKKQNAFRAAMEAQYPSSAAIYVYCVQIGTFTAAVGSTGPISFDTALLKLKELVDIYVDKKIPEGVPLITPLCNR